MPVISQHNLYVNVNFGRSYVLPAILFLGPDQNGTTVNVNSTADKM